MPSPPNVPPQNVKFSSQLEAGLLAALREHSAETGRSLANLLCEAVADYLERVRVRPAFRDAAREVLDENAELLGRLAR